MQKVRHFLPTGDIGNRVEVATVLAVKKAVAKKTPAKKKTAKKKATKIKYTPEQVYNMIEQLTEIASTFSLYARLPEKQPRLVPADQLLQETLAAYAGTLPPEVHLEVELPTSLPALWVDPALIKRALVNLIENALQAMPDGGTLTLKAQADAGLLHLEVTDSGAGMPGSKLLSGGRNSCAVRALAVQARNSRKRPVSILIQQSNLRDSRTHKP